MKALDLLNEKREELRAEGVLDYAEELRGYDSWYSDAMIEVANFNVDTYPGALLKWLREDEDAVALLEMVVNEGFYDTKDYDFYAHLQEAQFYGIRNDIESNADDIALYIAYSFLVDEGADEVDADAVAEVVSEWHCVCKDQIENLRDELRKLLNDGADDAEQEAERND